MSGRPDPWTKNGSGVKDGCDCYRTINGIRWHWWPAPNVDQLRAAGLRVRRYGREVFVHPEDEERADYITFGPSNEGGARG